jgi:uncharacterized repeat protein (TIGR01451 family)
VLERAVIIGTDLVIEGSAVPGATIEFFIADPDPSGFGEGQTYLVTRTEGRARDADDTGNRFRFVIPLADLAAPVMAGDLLTSTATRATDGTSEFSGNIEIDGDEPQVPVADLAVTKRANVPGVVVGQLVTFTITARNLGPDLALGVVVTDLLPPGMAFVSAKPSQGFYQPGTGEWNVIALAPDGSATLRLTGRVTAAGTIRNTASIAFPGVDPNPSNNVDRLTLPPGADLAVTKMVTPAAPAFGTPATFTLVVRNLGPGLATGVVLHDPLPAGLTFLGATASQGVYNPASGVWTVGNLGAGGMAVLQIVVRMDTVLPVVNTAVVTSASFDPNLSNNLASALVAALISKRPFLSFPGAA